MDSIEAREFRRQLKRLERLTEAQIDTCCAGITMAQCHALTEIRELGTTTTKQLAERLDLDSSTLSRTVDGLVRKGLVERLVSDRDRRVVPLRLTENGETLGRSIDQRSDEHYQRRLERLSEGERRRVLQAFETLVRALSGPVAEDDESGCE